MSGTASINIRVDPMIKAEAEELYSSLGMSLSTAINIFLRQSLLHCKLPFEVSLPRPNAETVAAFLEAERLSADPNARTFANVEELLEDLRGGDAHTDI
jgi:DNA-damage-inducible protein J